MNDDDLLFLQTGAVRSKASVNVAQRNLASAAVSIPALHLPGFVVMFGVSRTARATSSARRAR